MRRGPRRNRSGHAGPSVRQDASPLVEQEPVPFEVEVTGLGDRVHDTSTRGQDIEVRRERFLARLLLGVTGGTEPDSAGQPIRVAVFVNQGDVLWRQRAREVEVPRGTLTLMEHRLERS